MNKVVILAAGYGRRMQSELPKVLVEIKGRPMIEYLLDSVMETGIDPQPTIVVSPFNHEIIAERLKKYPLSFALQEEPLGTGHAVLSAKNKIDPKVKNVLVLYGDHPFIKAESILNLYKIHTGKISMMTVDLEDFADWRKNFYHWGRIIRKDNKIREIIEFKDADEELKKIKEVNPALFCFDQEWLFENIEKIKNNNQQKEYYLTDLIKIAFEQDITIDSVLINALEAIGVNSPEELEIARQIAMKK